MVCIAASAADSTLWSRPVTMAAVISTASTSVLTAVQYYSSCISTDAGTWTDWTSSRHRSTASLQDCYWSTATKYELHVCHVDSQNWYWNIRMLPPCSVFIFPPPPVWKIWTCHHMVFAAHSSMSLSTDGGVGCAEIVKGSKLKVQYLPASLQCEVWFLQSEVRFLWN